MKALTSGVIFGMIGIAAIRSVRAELKEVRRS